MAWASAPWMCSSKPVSKQVGGMGESDSQVSSAAEDETWGTRPKSKRIIESLCGLQLLTICISRRLESVNFAVLLELNRPNWLR